ncbi:histone RNA hairpin-binding protein RNA-binding domain-containing protein, partial [Pelagophyceae sp. CCMP2097]
MLPSYSALHQGGAAPELDRRSTLETDPHLIAQRKKVLFYDLTSPAYDRYVRAVPKHLRRRGDPLTPDVTIKTSTREFNQMVAEWRQQLVGWE